MSKPRKRITIPTVLSEIAKPLVDKQVAEPISRADSPRGKKESQPDLVGQNSIAKLPILITNKDHDFIFRDIVDVRPNEHLVRNIWFPDLQEMLPCKFLSFDGATDRI